MKSFRLNSKNKLSTPGSQTTVYADYSSSKKILEVEFRGGKTYHYFDVTEQVWEEYKNVIQQGKSSGEFINFVVKPNYTFKQLPSL